MFKSLFLVMLILVGLDVHAMEVKKGDPIGTVVQTETPERLNQFPITTLKRHREQLKPMEMADAKNQNIIDPRSISWGFRLTFKGEIRSIPKSKKKFLEMLATSSGKAPFFNLYSDEVLVSDGNEEFWLPLQSSFLKAFKSEVKKGDLFQAYTRYFGSYFDDKPIQLFLMVEFAQIPKTVEE